MRLDQRQLQVGLNLYYKDRVDRSMSMCTNPSTRQMHTHTTGHGRRPFLVGPTAATAAGGGVAAVLAPPSSSSQSQRDGKGEGTRLQIEIRAVRT